METPDLTRFTAAQISDVLRSGAASAREVAQAHLDRIAAVDGEIHAFLHVDVEGALACHWPSRTS
jgi:aspartyl-tRNA(Asn)/glutamyl-tRNA(Gln) amidotransferase subunit A